jgi:hypothetical protein
MHLGSLIFVATLSRAWFAASDYGLATVAAGKNRTVVIAAAALTVS